MDKHTFEGVLPDTSSAARTGRLRVLVWCPHVNAEGGSRLLVSLMPALAKQPEIELIRLLVPGQTTLPALDVGPVAGLEIVPIPSRRQAFKHLRWLEASGRLFGIPGTFRLKRALRRRLWETRWVWLLARLRELASDCDIVYAFWPHEQDYPDFTKPVVCTFQDATIFDFPEILGGDRTNLEYQRARVWFERSSQVVVSSEATRASLIRQFGASLGSARVIHHAILPPAGPMEESRSSPARKLPEKYFLCLANITAHENLDTLLIAWSRFARRHDYPLILAGYGTELITRSLPVWPVGFQGSRLAGLVQRLGLGLELDKTVFVLGFVEDAEAASLLKGAFALLLPTLAEGGGSFPAEEALTRGVPVCCSDIAVMREHLGQHSTRTSWFDPLMPDSITAALDSMIDDYADYKASAVQGMSDPRPSWDDVAQAYVDVFLAAAPRSSDHSIRQQGTPGGGHASREDN